MISKLMKKLPKPARKRLRRYPIRRDQSGRSARQRCFTLFDNGSRPADASAELGVSQRTAARYYASWKKLPRNLESRYQLLQTLRKTYPAFTGQTIKWLEAELDMTEEEVLDRLEDVQKPWGIKRLLKGEWLDYLMEGRRQERQQRRSQAEHRLEVALLIVCFNEAEGVSFEAMAEALEKLRPLQPKEGPGAT